MRRVDTMGLGNLSYRIKIPLGFSLAIMFSGVLLTTILLTQTEKDFRRDLFNHAVDLGSVLSASLISTMKHDDIWKAYQILNSADGSKIAQSRLLVVLDMDGLVYVSSEPKRFPIQSDPQQINAEFAQLSDQIKRLSQLQPFTVEDDGFDYYYIVYPLIIEGIKNGDLIMGFPRSLVVPRLYAIYWQVTLTSLFVLCILIPVGWWVGKRIADPLSRLARSMSMVGRIPLQQIHCERQDDNDEIGQLNLQFQGMIDELQEKERLTSQLLVNERLAAIGQLASGIAHEINNPLGGMLNSIRTLRRFGATDPVVCRKTSDLLERGLEQIQEIVSALLVQARVESHPLVPDDIDDIHTLLQPSIQKKQLLMTWRNRLDSPLSLPSTPVRQILINLCLNAVQASPEGAPLSCQVDVQAGILRLTVENRGDQLSTDELGRLFEPFVQGRKGGSAGLGLWVTYQVIEQLQGEIEVESENGVTRFDVSLPLKEAA